jgi:ubiquitin carboxyl-terminal hydrolase 31
MLIIRHQTIINKEVMKMMLLLHMYPQIPLFHMRIADGLGDGSPTYLDPTLDHPLYMEAVEQALALCEEDAGPPHLKLVLEWDLQGKERYVA